MATPGSNPPNPNPADDEARVGRIEAEALSWKNILNLKQQINKATKEEASLTKEVQKLQGEQARQAMQYQTASRQIVNSERRLKEAQLRGDQAAAQQEQARITRKKAEQDNLARTVGGALKQQELAAKKQKDSLTAERQLIKDINKERGIGAKFLDMFRSKEAKQRSIDLARAKAGGGANVGPAAAGSQDSKNKGAGGVIAGALGLGGIIAGIALLKSKMAGLLGGLMGPLKGIGGALKSSMVAPLNDAAKLMGGGVGMGGGAVTGEGATSLLGGLSSMVKTIPFIGGLLGGLVDGFKALVDAVLGVEAANVRVARTLGISKGAAIALRDRFTEVANSSNNIVVNATRLLESEIELNQQLGIQAGLTNDIVENNVKLKELAGFELAERKAIAESSIITMRSATGITKGVLAQVVGFKQLTGIAFNFKSIFGEAAKLGGNLGLQFAKYPEKIARTLMVTKALGFDLKSLDSQASSFLDFESSISKEFEAQVLTGKQLNLTKAREAALNNDLVGLAREVTKEVGSTEDFLKMNRIQQEAIAESVGMTRDSLSDTLKQQEMFTKLGATNIKQATERLELLRQQGKTEKEINRMLGEDAYNYITQTSTAERLTEMMNRIKTVFVDFIAKSGILDFITDPQKVTAFVKGIIDKLAGAVTLIGDIMAGVLRAIGSLPFTDKGKWESLADRVQGGAGTLAGAFTASGASFGGGDSVGQTLVEGKKSEMKTAQASAQTGKALLAPNQSPTFVGSVNIDNQPFAKVFFRAADQSPTKTFE